MYIVIGNPDKVKIVSNHDIIYLTDICSLKKIEASSVIFLIDEAVNDDGIIESGNYYFEEILISLNIEKIITNSCNDKLIEICNFYKIDLIII